MSYEKNANQPSSFSGNFSNNERAWIAINYKIYKFTWFC